jgi:hypothetical protein
MKQKTRKSLNQYVRNLHRHVGFFIVGLIIVYSLSGIVLIYRDTNFLKREVPVEKKLSPNLADAELGNALQLRNFKTERTEGDIVYFQNGTYNKVTGEAAYSSTELPPWIKKLTDLHKTPSKNAKHWSTIVFGVLLLFMALSSFWMFKPGTTFFRKGIYMACAGIVAAVILLVL